MHAMASPPSPDLSPAGALLMVFAAVIGPAWAPFASAYTMILLGWFAGLLIATYLRPVDGKRFPILAFAFVSLVVVLGVTVPLSNFVAHYASTAVPGGPVDAQGLFLVISVAIPAIGHRWVAIAKLVAARIRRHIMGANT